MAVRAAPAQPHIPSWLLDEIAAEEGASWYARTRTPIGPAVDALAATTVDGVRIVRPFLTGRRSRVLEIGSGNGFALLGLLLGGVDAYGLEPGNTESFHGRRDRAVSLLRANGIEDAAARVIEGVGEAIPVPDGAFDVVFSNAVLEHVHDLEAVIRESVRVLAPGGIAVHHVVDYDHWREHHYLLPWLPYLLRSKRAARAWVRLWGRDPGYVDELTFTTPSMLRAAAQTVPDCEWRLFGRFGYPLPRASVVSSAHIALALGQHGQHPLTDRLLASRLRGPVTALLGGLIRVAQVCGLVQVPMLVLRRHG